MSNKGKKFYDLDQLAEFFSKELGKKLTPIAEKLDHVYNYMKEKFPDFKPVVQAGSLKRITEHGQEIIEKYNVESYLEEKCELLKKDFSGNTDTEIFIECDKWVKNEGKTKVVEIRIHTNLSQEVCDELVALCLLYRIKKSNPDK